MNISKYLRKQGVFYSLIGGLIASGLGLIKFSDEVLDQYDRIRTLDVKPHLEETREDLDRRLEERLGVPSSNAELREGFVPFGSMQYRSDEDVIVVDPNSLYSAYSLDELTWFEREFFIQKSVDGGYIHERGHEATFDVINSLEDKGLFHPSFEDEENSLHYLILKEGIAEYCSIRLGEEKLRDFETVRIDSLGKLKRELKNLRQKSLREAKYEDYERFNEIHRQLYQLSSHIVSPILDAYGMEEGISRIFSNPIITEDEIRNPELYHSRMVN